MTRERCHRCRGKGSHYRTAECPPALGRPLSGEEKKKRTNVALEPRVADLLRRFGDGNLSQGIERAARIAEQVLQDLKVEASEIAP